MRDDHYPPGSVTGLLHSADLHPVTAAVLLQRMEDTARLSPPLLSPELFALLQAVCALFFPGSAGRIPLAAMIEKGAAGPGRGWRYEALPVWPQALRAGLTALDEEALAVFGQPFTGLPDLEKTELLQRVQSGHVSWTALPAPLFFTELLVAATEAYCSHPLAKEEMGETAFADAPGWSRIGLNELEPREPRPVNPSTHADH